MTLKVDLNLDPGTDSPVRSEALAYSAASESSDDDEKNIIADPSSSSASSWMNSSLSCGSMLSGIYTDSARIEAKVIEYEIRQRRSGSVEKPQRGNIPAALLKRHSTDNILRPTPSLDGEMDQDSLGSPRQRSCSVNLPTDNPTRADEAQRCGVVRSASSGSAHSGSVVSEQIVLEGQVEVVDEDGILRSFWAIYDDLSLALYPDQFAIDPEGLIAVSSCNVQMAEVGEEGQSAIKLSRVDRDPIFLYAGSDEATRRWHDVMKDDVTKLAIEGLNLEDANSREFQIDAEVQLEEEKKRKFKEDLARIRKEQLLTELLQQKHDLELKQKLKSKMASPDSTSQGQGSVPSDDDSDDFDGATELQMVKDITYLKQRRISTQIKVDTIQKQLQESQKKPEKRLFKFALGKKEHTTDSNKKDHLESQFKELTGKLETINENLTKQESEQEKLKKQRNERKHLHNSFSSGDMSKNPALTLALDSQRPSDDLRLSASQPASSLSRPRALTSPPAVLQKQQLLSSLSANWAGEKEKRKSEPPRPKPKLEIDPTALAEIEEFEKMTKMFLSRHSTPGFRM